MEGKLQELLDEIRGITRILANLNTNIVNLMVWIDEYSPRRKQERQKP